MPAFAAAFNVFVLHDFFFFAAASLLGFGAPLCCVVGGLNPSITPLSRERRSSRDLR